VPWLDGGKFWVGRHESRRLVVIPKSSISPNSVRFEIYLVDEDRVASFNPDIMRRSTTGKGVSLDEASAALRAFRTLVEKELEEKNRRFLERRGKVFAGIQPRSRDLPSQTIRHLELKLQATSTRVERFPPPLAERDLQLCLAWHNVSDWQTIHPSRFSSVEGFMKPFEANRLGSARHADISAILYYQALGFQVEDVSIGQLSSPDGRWRDFDLLVNGMPMDVKNARRSFSNPDTYVEHTIPRFKVDRESGLNVNIVGVLSDYIHNENIDTYPLTCLVLGQVNVGNIRELYLWMQSRFGDFLDLKGMWNPKFHAGWVFEYPIEHYPDRQEAIAAIPETLSQCISNGLGLADIPHWMPSLTDDASLIEQLGFTKSQQAIWSDLRSLQREVGLSRPSLYCYVLGYMLEGLAIQKPLDEVFKLVTDALFPNGLAAGARAPLGLQDNLEYIANLLKMLAAVYREILNRGDSFTAFNLTHPQILRGMKADCNWLTLYAYCGGWRRYPVVAKCGAGPLYLGKHAHCGSCGHLICVECGFCSSSCPEVEGRQERHTTPMVMEAGKDRRSNSAN